MMEFDETVEFDGNEQKETFGDKVSNFVSEHGEAVAYGFYGVITLLGTIVMGQTVVYMHRLNRAMKRVKTEDLIPMITSMMNKK